MTYKNMLETERLILRSLSIDDFEAVHARVCELFRVVRMCLRWGKRLDKIV